MITGLGAVFPGGSGAEGLLRTLREGASLLKPSRPGAPTLAARIDADLKAMLPRKGLTALSRSALLAAAAVENLLLDAPGLLPEDRPGECALVTGTAFGHLESKAQFHDEARQNGVRLVSPILFPNTIINSLAGHAAILFGLPGPNSTVTSGRRSGLEAILRASLLLRAGRAARAIVLGADAISGALLSALEASAAKDAARAEGGGLAGAAPARTAVAPGEGSAAALLELEDHLPSHRQARGRILGAAERNRGRGPLQVAVSAALSHALEAAGLKAREVGWISLSRSGLEILDGPETEAVQDVFGTSVPRVALKGIFGETFGAHGMISLAAALVASRAGFIPRVLANPGAREDEGPSGSIPPRPDGAGAAPVILSAVDHEGATALVIEPFWA